jgi:hypothetical protein
MKISKLAINSLIGLTWATLNCAALVGCASQNTGLTPEQEDANASEDDLRATAAKLAGTFAGSTGEGLGAGIEKVVFTKEGTFFAIVDTGLRCVRAPCPSSLRIDGTFKATTKYLTLSSLAGTAASPYHGRYTYTFSGDKLAFKHTGATPYASELTRKSESFCEQVSDCVGQPQPNRLMCVPAPRVVCEENAQCSNTCAPRTVTISGAMKIVASNQGGFLPISPPGSTCRLASSYSLDVATKTLSWELCRSPGPTVPFNLLKGSRVLLAHEFGQIERLLDKVQVGSTNNCGADAAKKSITVSSAAGDKVFVDAFFACEGGNTTYVENLGEVFAAFGTIAEPQ